MFTKLAAAGKADVLATGNMDLLVLVLVLVLVLAPAFERRIVAAEAFSGRVNGLTG